MAQAAVQGGYPAVIEYLKSADPDRAMSFETQKVALDNSLMKNDMYSYMLPFQKNNALIDAYGALGKMGTAILRAPPGEQQAMYNVMRPLVTAVNPDAPTDVNQAAPMFMLGAAQATPPALLYGNLLMQAKMQGDVGKAILDHTKISQIYGPDSPQAQQAQNAIGDTTLSKTLANAKTAGQVVNQAGAAQISGENALKNDYDSQNKNFLTVSDNYNKIQQIKATYTDPKTKNFGPSDVALMYGIMKMIAPNAQLRQGAVATVENSGGLAQHYVHEYNSLLEGGTLSPTVRTSYIKSAQTLYDAADSGHTALTAQYKQTATDRNYNPDHVVSPVDSVYINNQSLINQKADAYATKYANQPEALQQVEKVRAQQLQKLQDEQRAKDYRSNVMLNQYGRGN
jgi:hypothetical protein